jgi:hypothetical protein
MGESIWRLGGVRKYTLKFASEQRPKIYSKLSGYGRARSVCLTFDTTGQKTEEPEGLSDVPCVTYEHIHD